MNFRTWLCVIDDRTRFGFDQGTPAKFVLTAWALAVFTCGGDVKWANAFWQAEQAHHWKAVSLLVTHRGLSLSCQ